jgi:quercetin dioxygenase-like cupin family protein
MKRSVASWTLFDPSEVSEQPIARHPGVFGKPLVDNTDGSSLLSVRYEPGAGDDERRHAVGQTVLVLEGELSIDGQSCGPGAGAALPADVTYSLRAGDSGAVAVEFRPAPIAYGRVDVDTAEADVKPITASLPSYAWATMTSAGPVTSKAELSYFDLYRWPEKQLGPTMSIQALVNQIEDDGHSMLMVHHAPGYFQAEHSHDVDQIVVVIEGTLTQGNRRFGPGMGFFTPKGRHYTFGATEDRDLLRVEWRPSPLRFATEMTERGLAGVRPAASEYAEIDG